MGGEWRFDSKVVANDPTSEAETLYVAEDREPMALTVAAAFHQNNAFIIDFGVSFLD